MKGHRATGQAMLDREQATAAAEALLGEGRRAQHGMQAKLASARARRRVAGAGTMTAGALLGMVAGGGLGYLLAGNTSPWSVAGSSVGLAMGLAIAARRKA